MADARPLPSPARRRRSSRSPVTEGLERRQLLSTTYYVSPTGSDANPGTTADQPWATAAMVNGAALVPGDTVLFQRGGTWRESLNAPADGAAGNPISFGAYGDPAAARPLFSGADLLVPSAFTLVAGTTYSAPVSAGVNWVAVDGGLLRQSNNVLTYSGNASAGDSATNRAYVQANPGSFYFDSAAATVYLNTGADPTTGHTIEAARRVNAVSNEGHSHLAFDDLDVVDTAANNDGYGYRVQDGSDVTVTNATATNTGKHAFGAINSDAFVGRGLTASVSAPDQGIGGASMLVFFVDSNNAPANESATFADCTYLSPGGVYPIMVSHGEGTNPIASLTMTNLTSTAGAAGLNIYATGPTAKVTLTGGHIASAGIDLEGTTGAVVQGVTLSGTGATVTLGGTGNVVQNCLFTGIDPSYNEGRPAAVVDSGTDNVVRFNTFTWSGGGGAAVSVQNAAVDTALSGNLFDCPQPIRLQYDPQAAQTTLTSDRNLFRPGAVIATGATYAVSYVSIDDWRAAGYDPASVIASPAFADAAGGNYALSPDSPAIDLVTATPTQTPAPLTTDLAGNPRPFGGGYDAGAYEIQQAPTPIDATFAVSQVAAAAPGRLTSATFAVTLSAPLAAPATVAYATVDGSATAYGGDYAATSGTLTFAPGQTVRYVRVPVTPNGFNVNATFSLTITSPSSGTQVAAATATSAVPVAPTDPTSIPVGSGQSIPYADGSARPVGVRLAGPGQLILYRTALAGDVVQLYAVGTTAASRITLATNAATHTTLGSVYVDGSLGRLTAPTADLLGDLTVTGSLGHVTLGNVTGPSTITLSGTKGRPSFAFDAVSDLSVASTVPLGSFSASSWSAPHYGEVSAPSVAALRVAGPFAPNLTLTDDAKVSLGSAALGNVTAGTWLVAGRVGSVSARSTASSWSATVAGPVRSVTTAGDLAGSMTAPSIGTVRVGHDLTAATIALTGPMGRGYDLNTLVVNGTVSSSALRSAGNVNAVTVGSITDSTVFAGVAPTVSALPTSTADFASGSRLNRFTVTGRGAGATGALAGSIVAAANVGSVRVTGTVQTANNGTPFGFAADALSTYTALVPGQKVYVWRAKDAAALPSDGDYRVVVL